jgi:hypothetical protein
MLKYSDVVFSESEHTYTTPDGKRLSGITELIDRQIFGGRFARLPESLWREQADYGTAVHRELDTFWTVGENPTLPEAKAFIAAVKHWDYDSEYLVTDGEHFATKIDFLYEYDGKTCSVNYKTGAVLDMESVAWQSSIEGYLFELQNGYTIDLMYVAHLRGDECQIIELTPKSREAVLSLLQAEMNSESYMCPQEGGNAELSKLLTLETQIVAYKEYVETFEEQKKAVLEGLLKQMEGMGLKKWETEKIILTRVEPTIRESLDTKKLKEALPDVYNEYVKTSTVKGSVRITIK